MILISRNTKILNRLHPKFSQLFSEQNNSGKVETMSFKRNVVNDFTKISYEPQQKLTFTNGKCLIYKNNRTILTSLSQSALYWGPILGIAGLIYTNPCKNIFIKVASFFPAAIPILYFTEVVLIKLWMNFVKKNQNIVSEIYLLQGGETTQIYFANKNKRKLFGEQFKKLYYNSIFVDPDFQKQEIIMLSQDSRKFPFSIEQARKQKGQGYAWVKHFSNGENMLIIPKQPEYANLKVLIEIFKGKVIKD